MMAAALYLQLQDQFPEFHPFPDDDLTDCLRLSLDDLPQLRVAGLSVDANRFVLHGSSSYPGKSAEVICSGWAAESGMGCGGSGLAEG